MKLLGLWTLSAYSEGAAMKLLVALLVVVVIAVIIDDASMRSRYRALAQRESTLRFRAHNLAFVAVMDGTRRVEPSRYPASIELTGVEMFYAPIPQLVVKEWAHGGIVDGPLGVSSAQWQCPPTYKLKWDGSVPYCEPLTEDLQ
jgi:hypothetical protein